MLIEACESNGDTWEFCITDSRPSIAVIEAMAFVKNRDPTNIEPLYRVICPDALDGVLSGADAVTVSFTWEEHNVVVSAADIIAISKCEGASQQSTSH